MFWNSASVVWPVTLRILVEANKSRFGSPVVNMRRSTGLPMESWAPVSRIT